MKQVSFTPTAFDEYNEWIRNNPEIIPKILELIRDISRNPFKGLGKPEPLKGNFKGFWSRRITQEHRLVYKVDSDSIFIVKCRGHYE